MTEGMGVKAGPVNAPAMPLADAAPFPLADAPALLPADPPELGVLPWEPVVTVAVAEVSADAARVWFGGWGRGCCSSEIAQSRVCE